jgi:hypothetical protein
MTEFREVKLTTERDTIINSSTTDSMTEFRGVKSTVDDLRVDLEVERQIDKDVSCSPVIEVGGERDASINRSASVSMTEFREVKSTADDLRVELEVKNHLDKYRVRCQYLQYRSRNVSRYSSMS